VSAALQEIINEEFAHIASFNSIPQSLFDDVVNGMSDADYEYVISTYFKLSKKGAAESRANLKSSDPKVVKGEKERLVEEFLRQQYQDKEAGFTTEDSYLLLKGEKRKPVRDLVIAYLKGMYRRITKKTRNGRFLSGPERAAIARITDEINTLRMDFKTPLPYGYTFDDSPQGAAADIEALSQMFPPQEPDVLGAPAITPEQDADYLAAVESGDMETAQRMVDEAAKAEGYDVKAFHGTGREFDSFSGDAPKNYFIDDPGFFFTNDREDAEQYASYAEYLENEAGSGSGKSRVVNAYLNLGKNYDYGEISAYENVAEWSDEEWGNQWQSMLIRQGYESFKASKGEETMYIVFNPNQIKSADPITRDADGNVIPLSQRFDEREDSILRAPAFASELGDINQDVPADQGGDLPPSTFSSLAKVGYKPEASEGTQILGCWSRYRN
jgi:hypothetical protein